MSTARVTMVDRNGHAINSMKMVKRYVSCKATIITSQSTLELLKKKKKKKDICSMQKKVTVDRKTLSLTVAHQVPCILKASQLKGILKCYFVKIKTYAIVRLTRILITSA